MESLEGFIEAPQESEFFNVIYQGGFELIEAGEQVSTRRILGGKADDTLPVFPFAEDMPLEDAKKIRPMLLLPKGPPASAVNCLHAYFNGEEPLFQQFASLKTDADILSFAGKYGNLRHTVCVQGIPYRISLEMIATWRQEIAIVRRFLELRGDFEMGKELPMTVNGRMACLNVRVNEWESRSIRLLVKTPDPRKLIAKALLGAFLDERMAKAPLTVSHKMQDGIYKSLLTPLSLLGAVWLQLSQSFFGDGPAEEIVRRCVLTGIYCRERNSAGEKIMWRKKTGPYKGHHYHRDMLRRFSEQKRKRDRAAREGKTVKEGRKGATTFLVGFDEWWGEKPAPEKGQ
ncbi:MAG: hypothetical protein ACOYJV_00125 [Aminivibrio sp.]|jgi:hypothetical protein